MDALKQATYNAARVLRLGNILEVMYGGNFHVQISTREMCML